MKMKISFSILQKALTVYDWFESGYAYIPIGLRLQSIPKSNFTMKVLLTEKIA